MPREWVNFTTMVGIAIALFIMWWYYHTNSYQERVVARRKQRANWLRCVASLEDVLYKAIEKAADNGQIDRLHIPRIHAILRKAGFRELNGDEPSFGRPWYYGPAKIDLKSLKGRLKQKWDHARLDHERASIMAMGKGDTIGISEEDRKKLRASIKRGLTKES